MLISFSLQSEKRRYASVAQELAVPMSSLDLWQAIDEVIDPKDETSIEGPVNLVGILAGGPL